MTSEAKRSLLIAVTIIVGLLQTRFLKLSSYQTVCSSPQFVAICRSPTCGPMMVRICVNVKQDATLLIAIGGFLYLILIKPTKQKSKWDSRTRIVSKRFVFETIRNDLWEEHESLFVCWVLP